MKRAILTLAALALLLGGTGQAKAGIATFDDLPVYTGGYSSVINDGGLTFTSFGYAQVFPSGSPGADNGTQFLLFDYGSSEYITATGGGPFTLSSLDLGLSYYTAPTDLVSITFNYAAGGSSTVTENVDQTFQTFTFSGPALSSVVISEPLISGGYTAIDNLASAAVPEPATVTMLGIGLAGLAGYGVRRRKQRAAVA